MLSNKQDFLSHFVKHDVDEWLTWIKFYSAFLTAVLPKFETENLVKCLATTTAGSSDAVILIHFRKVRFVI